MATTYRVVRQRAGGRTQTADGWRGQAVTVAIVATGLSERDAEEIVRRDRQTSNFPHRGISGYWLTAEVE